MISGVSFCVGIPAFRITQSSAFHGSGVDVAVAFNQAVKTRREVFATGFPFEIIAAVTPFTAVGELARASQPLEDHSRNRSLTFAARISHRILSCIGPRAVMSPTPRGSPARRR